MKPEPFIDRRQLSLTLRGPEFAVLIPFGDFDVLNEVCGKLASIWNGVGTLLIPVGGKTDEPYQKWLDILSVDQLLYHEKVTPEQRNQIDQDLEIPVHQFSDFTLQQEVHIWRLASGTKQARPLQLRFDEKLDPVLRTLLWGELDEDDEAFLAVQGLIAKNDPSPAAIVRAQLNRDSPLAWSAIRTDLVSSVNAPGPNKSVYVFGADPDFEELLLFWNLRARLTTHDGEATILGVPNHALRPSVEQGIFRDYADAIPQGVKPDFRVGCSEELRSEIEALLSGDGFEKAEPRETYYRQVPEERSQREFAFGTIFVGGRIRRGTQSNELADLKEGVNKTQFQRPEELPKTVDWTGTIRYELTGVPELFPLSNAIAGLHMNGGQARGEAISGGIMLSGKSPAIDLNIPPPDMQLETHLAAFGYRGTESSAGRIARTLLEKVDRESLSSLATPEALDILNALVRRNSSKIATRLARKVSDGELDQEKIDELIAAMEAESSFLEIPALTLSEIGSDVSKSPSGLRKAMGDLVEAGFVTRGRKVTCPICRFPDYWALGELDERLLCRHCGSDFPLPAFDPSGEIPNHFRLEGMTARAVDQGIPAVLLSLRFLLDRPEGVGYRAWWPGLDLIPNGRQAPEFETDLLFACDGRLWSVECKSNAAALNRDNARAHVEQAKKIGAEPAVAAPAGTFSSEVIQVAEDENLQIFSPAELLS